MTSEEMYVMAVMGVVGYWGTAATIRHFKLKKDNAEAQEIASQQKAQKEEEIREKSRQEQDRQRREEEKRRQDEEHERQRRAEKEGRSLLWNEVLGIDLTASLEEIRLAYKKKISMYHPDKVSNLGPEFNEIAQRKSKEINAAYEQAIKLKKY